MIVRVPNSTPETLTAASATTAETLFGDCTWLKSPGGPGSHRHSGRATRRPNWPERCQRALARYLAAQDGRDFVLDLPHGEVDGIAEPGRSFAHFPARDYPQAFAESLLQLKTQGA